MVPRLIELVLDVQAILDPDLHLEWRVIALLRRLDRLFNNELQDLCLCSSVLLPNRDSEEVTESGLASLVGFVLLIKVFEFEFNGLIHGDAPSWLELSCNRQEITCLLLIINHIYSSKYTLWFLGLLHGELYLCYRLALFVCLCARTSSCCLNRYARLQIYYQCPGVMRKTFSEL